MVRIAEKVGKSSFVRPEIRTQNRQCQVKLWRRKHSNLIKDLLTAKTLLVDQRQPI